MEDHLKTQHSKRWTFALCLAVLQVSVAIFAIWSSSRDILSDGACIGGIFGTLANLGVLSLATVAALINAVHSLKTHSWRPWLSQSVFLCATSLIAIAIGLYAGLRCSV